MLELPSADRSCVSGNEAGVSRLDPPATRQPAPSSIETVHVNDWMTWANLLTLCRACLALPCAFAASQGAWGVALALFLVAVVTDLADGPLARRHGTAGALGGLLDHTTDAAFVALTLAALAVTGFVPWLLPPLVVAAFAQYLLDSRALAGRPLRASALGRWNGIGYFVLAGAVLIAQALALPWPVAVWQWLGWLLVASTLLSMADRARARLRTE